MDQETRNAVEDMQYVLMMNLGKIKHKEARKGVEASYAERARKFGFTGTDAEVIRKVVRWDGKGEPA